MPDNSINMIIGGEAGQGIISSSILLAKVFTRGGLYAFILNEYPNTIKGLHNWCSIRISSNPLASQTHTLDLLIALNKDTIQKHGPELNPGCGLIYDPADANITEILHESEYYKIYPLPLNKIIEDLKVEKVMRNSVAIGAALGIVNYDFEIMAGLLKELFQRKGDKIVSQNIDVAKAGFDYARQNFAGFSIQIQKRANNPLMLLSGNEAASIGAIKAGAKMLCAYPMTPTSSIIHYMALKQEKYDFVVKHTEDEIAAINMAIGASYAGARAFVCTSGGGFALMTEALGLAAISETGVVLIVGQRPGPSTGQPTHTSQADLRFLIHASQGEFPRFVIAPGDIEECFYETYEAFNLAEKFQIPVLIITDKYLGESYRSCEKFDTSKLKIDRGKLLTSADLEEAGDYRRYEFTEDGVSPRTIPGQKNGIHIATSYEHDEYGFYEETSAGVVKMGDKRFYKLCGMKKNTPDPKSYGDKDAKINIISWGSTKGVIFEAMEMLKAEGTALNFHQIVYIFPFPADYISQVMTYDKKIVVIEANKTAQLAGLIREYTGKEAQYKLLKYDGQPFYPIEIYNYIKGIN